MAKGEQITFKAFRTRFATDKGLAGQLGISYESAWFLLVRIRRAMRERDQRYLLNGLVEMDEAYLGAPKRGKKRGQ